jgi:hypothetical protein
VASVLGARYILADPGSELTRGDGGEAGGGSIHGLRMVYDGVDARVFSNARAAPRALVAPRVRVVAGEAQARAALVEDSFDPRREVVVERGAEGTDAMGTLGAGGGGGSTGRVSVSDRSNASTVIDAELSRPGLVVLNDAWAPGLSVQVDGHDAEPVRVNDVMRGVAVPAGRHEVDWRYRVPGLRAGALISLLGLLLCAGAAVALRRRRTT